jgi:predicted metalloprotease with PDZ domain
VEYQRAPTPIRLRAAFNPGPSAGLLYPDDEIVALDGIRVRKPDELEGRVRQRRPGDRVRIHVFRRDRLEGVTVTLGQAPANRYRLVRRDDSGPHDRTGYERWLEAGWPEPSAGASD